MAEAIERNLPSVELRRQSTAEQVAGALRGLIVARALGPGTHLSEGPLSQQLGVSRNTVREALQILISQGLVRREIHRGAYVSELDVEDIRDLFRVRRLIEIAAVRECAQAGTDLSELDPQLVALSTATTSADARQAELQFWRTLVGLVRSERFGALHALAASELQLAAVLDGDEPTDCKRVVRQLRSVLSAMRKGDGDRAAAVAVKRLSDQESQLLARLGT